MSGPPGAWPAAKSRKSCWRSRSQHVVPLIGLDYRDDLDKAKLWLAQLGNPYTAVPFDGDGRTAINWGVYGAPETYLVDAHGRIIFKFISPMTEEVWEKEFLPRIAAATERRVMQAARASGWHRLWSFAARSRSAEPGAVAIG